MTTLTTCGLFRFARNPTRPTHLFNSAYACTQLNLPIVDMQADNGTELLNSTTTGHFRCHGIHLRLSCSYTSKPFVLSMTSLVASSSEIICLFFPSSLCFASQHQSVSPPPIFCATAEPARAAPQDDRLAPLLDMREDLGCLGEGREDGSTGTVFCSERGRRRGWG
jgi:hypothetical protein